MLVKTEWIERITKKYVSLSVRRNNNQHIGLIKMDLLFDSINRESLSQFLSHKNVKVEFYS